MSYPEYKHYCEDPEQDIRCWQENDSNELILTIFFGAGDTFFSGDAKAIVKFCPLCGYCIEKNNDTK